jgi:hypothetical protein
MQAVEPHRAPGHYLMLRLGRQGLEDRGRLAVVFRAIEEDFCRPVIDIEAHGRGQPGAGCTLDRPLALTDQ